MRTLRVRGVTQLEITQLVGHEVGFEPGPSECREMERSCSEGAGALDAQVHETQPHPVFDLEAAFDLLIKNLFTLE